MSGKKRVKSSKTISTDLKKIDQYVFGPKDHEEIPELTDESFQQGTFHVGGVPIPRGPGFKSRIDAALRKAAKLPKYKSDVKK
jgi:hypothetical protein